MATKHWVWLCRRHGRGGSRVLALLAGWAWAHKLAGLEVRAQWAVLRGGCAGLIKKAPPLPRSVRADGGAMKRLLKLRRE
jgi:hypothetical protein